MKKIVKSTAAACFFVTLMLACTKSHAQAMLNADTVKAQLIKDWKRAKDYTFAYLNTMPADKYGFKAVDSIRSFAQQMLHLSAGTFFLMSTATGATSPVEGKVDEKRASAQTKDSVVYYVGASYDFAIESLTKLDAAKLAENVPFKAPGGPFSRLTMALKAFEHQTHHRGQTTIYIRLLGIRPPNERLF